MFTHHRSALLEQLAYHVLVSGNELARSELMRSETPLEVPPTSPAPPPPMPTKAAKAA